ncbi:MAG: hypothetical protein II899_06730 [Bacteroidales bacterium]|nr:hypothetical protein [Bacteroidales bacterium]
MRKFFIYFILVLLLIWVLLLGALFIFILYTHSSSDKDIIYSNSKIIGDNLFVETYQTYRGGVYDGDAYKIYLTDSMSFRKKLGDYDDHDWPNVTVSGDIVVVKWNDHQLLRNRVRNCKISKLKEKGHDDLLNNPYVH